MPHLVPHALPTGHRPRSNAAHSSYRNRRSAPAYDQHGRVDPRWRPEGAARQPETGLHIPPPRRASRTRSAQLGEPPNHGPLKHHIRRDQLGRRRQQQAEQRAGHGIGRTGDDAKWPPRQPERDGIGVRHGDRHSGEPLPQQPHSPRMQLDGDDASTLLDQMGGQRALACADVEDKIPGPDPGRSYDPRGPFVNERMPAPRPARPRGGGHDGPCS